MNTWVLSALWVGLALIATLVAIWFRMSTALPETVVGTVAQLVIGAAFARGGLLRNTECKTFLATTGAIVLSFLAGAEPDPTIFRTKSREAVIIGLAGFFGPRASWNCWSILMLTRIVCRSTGSMKLRARRLIPVSCRLIWSC